MAANLQDLTKDQLAVYRVIGMDFGSPPMSDVLASAGNNGTWVKHIREQAHLPNQKDLEKILKILESKKLIRSFKSVMVRYRLIRL